MGLQLRHLTHIETDIPGRIPLWTFPTICEADNILNAQVVDILLKSNPLANYIWKFSKMYVFGDSNTLPYKTRQGFVI